MPLINEQQTLEAVAKVLYEFGPDQRNPVCEYPSCVIGMTLRQLDVFADVYRDLRDIALDATQVVEAREVFDRYFDDSAVNLMIAIQDTADAGVPIYTDKQAIASIEYPTWDHAVVTALNWLERQWSS